MKRFTVVFAIAALFVALGAIPAFPQASGSFEYSNRISQNGNVTAPTACTVSSSTGGITGGVECGPLSVGGAACTTTANCPAGETCSGQIACSLGSPCTLPGEVCDVSGFCSNSGICSGSASKTCIGDTEVAIKTSTGNGNLFDVRPSAVIALLTDVTVNSKQGSTATSSAFAGVDVLVSLTSQPATKGSGGPAVVTPAFAVTYDSRFIQISTNLFQAIAAQCQAIAGGCFITFNESTASAHSFDWIIAPLSSGVYVINAEWTQSLAVSGIGEAETCVGPVNLTVTQNKVFTPSQRAQSSLSF